MLRTVFIFIFAIILFSALYLLHQIYLQNLNFNKKHFAVYTTSEIIERKVLATSVILYDFETREKKMLISDPTRKSTYSIIEWSKDGKTLLIESLTGNTKDLFTVDVESKTSTPIKLPKVIQSSLGSSSLIEEDILFLSDLKNEVVISTYNRSREETRELMRIDKKEVPNVEEWIDFSFSPDKSKVLVGVFGFENLYGQIYLIDINSEKVRQLSSGDKVSDTSPKWLDENNVIFQRRDREGDSVWIKNIRTPEEYQLLGKKQGVDSQTAFRYAFPLGGKMVIYPSNLSGVGQNINSINIDTKESSKLFQIPYQDFTYAKVSSDYKYLIWGSLTTQEYGSRKISFYNSNNGKTGVICDTEEDKMCSDFLISP